jgi:predicted nucleic acid-binding protein
VRVYLDVSCLNRPFDDQSQLRVRLEAEAVLFILEQINGGVWEHVSSEITKVEIDANPDAEHRASIRLYLPDERGILKLTEPVVKRAALLQQLGIKRADALHVAAAEALNADVLLSCDDRLCRLAYRKRVILQVRVVNPVDWIKEIKHGLDA